MLRLSCLFAALLGVAISAHAAQRPNIVIIYADDVGYGDLGCYGATAIETPHLDALARRGLRFTAGYATSSTCTPSRYSLLTGEYPFRSHKKGEVRVLPGNAPLIIDVAQPTLPAVLKSAGYVTGLVGKWHLGLGLPDKPLNWNETISPSPKELGFDYSYHMAATGDRVPSVYIEDGRVVNLGAKDPLEVGYDGPVGKDPTGLSHPELLRLQADEEHGKTIVNGVSRIGWMSGGKSARWIDEDMSDTYLAKVIRFIDDHQKKPFFLLYAAHENHVPRLPHPRFQGATSLGPRGDAVVQLDWTVGRIVETLEKNGLLKNTLIIFSSDNGPVLYDGYLDGAVEMNGDHRPAGPSRGGKYGVREGGCRVPFILSWPDAIQPGLSSAIVSQVDLLSSLAALTGAALPANFSGDSENLLPALTGKTEKGRDHVVLQGLGNTSIRRGDWKYVPPGKMTERGGFDEWLVEISAENGALFFLPEDPEERTNLATVYPAKAAELRALLAAELKAKP